MIPCQVLYVSEDYDFAILQAQEKVPGRVAMELAPRGYSQGWDSRCTPWAIPASATN